MLGGGSNVLIADEGFPGTVVRVATRGIKADVSELQRRHRDGGGR